MNSYATFQGQAQATFLKAVAKLIRKISGSHCGSCEVQLSREGTHARLEYKGEDASDLGMNFGAHLVGDGNFDVSVIFFGNTIRGGDFCEERSFKTGEVNPDHVFRMFCEKFGRVA